MGRLIEIEDRWRQTTPGPWAWDSRGDKTQDVQFGIALDAEDHQISGFFDSEDVVYVEGIAEMVGSNAGADATAITACAGPGGDIAWLVAEVRRLRKELQELRPKEN